MLPPVTLLLGQVDGARGLKRVLSRGPGTGTDDVNLGRIRLQGGGAETMGGGVATSSLESLDAKKNGRFLGNVWMFW